MSTLQAKDIVNTPNENESENEQDSTARWIGALQSPRFKQVEQRVIRQLIEALLYEKILSHEYDQGFFVLEGRTQDDRVVHYRCAGEIKTGFGRIKLEKTPVVRLADNKAGPASLLDVLTEVVSRIPATEHLAAFMNELEQTLLKDLQAQSQPRAARLSKEQRRYDELEGNIMDAHSYHPCYKSRIGFSLNDNRLYGPEFKQPLQLHWLAVHGDNGGAMNHSRRIDYPSFFREELGLDDYRRFAAVLQRQNKNIDNYRLIPVHPWQWQEVISNVFHAELAGRDIVWLGAGSDAYRAQQSIRTLANFTDPRKAYVKLSLSITNTSTSRILAAHTVMNGPVITDWLHGLIEDDPYARELDFVILGEVLGVSYDYQHMPEARQSKAYGTLGAVWRESLHRYLRPQESATPFNGLCHVEENGQPLIDPWVRQHGVIAWTEQLLRVAVNPVIHMLFAHGIGMESHAQNIVLVHSDDGRPLRIALKDFHDGVRFSPQHLAYPERCPELYPAPASHARINRNSFILTDDLDAVRDFSCDSFFFICLSELSLFLERHYRLSEKQFWSMTADVIQAYQAEHPEHRARFEAFDVFAETYQVEELTKRRLFGDSQPRFINVPNPLHAFKPC